MADGITTFVPSRDRPERALMAFESHEKWSHRADSNIYIGLDHDEPQMDAYLDLLPPHALYVAQPEDSGSMSKVVNAMARDLRGEARLIGFMGDDHRIRTNGWDSKFLKVVDNTYGIVYGNDLFQGANLPTAGWMTTDIYEILGWFTPPFCDHMYIDNTWLTIGQQLGKLFYVPSVEIEHLHYAAGKGRMDDTYARTNTEKQMVKDYDGLTGWIGGTMKADMKRIKETLDGR